MSTMPARGVEVRDVFSRRRTQNRCLAFACPRFDGHSTEISNGKRHLLQHRHLLHWAGFCASRALGATMRKPKRGGRSAAPFVFWWFGGTRLTINAHTEASSRISVRAQVMKIRARNGFDCECAGPVDAQDEARSIGSRSHRRRQSAPFFDWNFPLPAGRTANPGLGDERGRDDALAGGDARAQEPQQPVVHTWSWVAQATSRSGRSTESQRTLVCRKSSSTAYRSRGFANLDARRLDLLSRAPLARQESLPAAAFAESDRCPMPRR